MKLFPNFEALEHKIFRNLWFGGKSRVLRTEKWSMGMCCYEDLLFMPSISRILQFSNIFQFQYWKNACNGGHEKMVFRAAHTHTPFLSEVPPPHKIYWGVSYSNQRRWSNIELIFWQRNLAFFLGVWESKKKCCEPSCNSGNKMNWNGVFCMLLHFKFFLPAWTCFLYHSLLLLFVVFVFCFFPLLALHTGMCHSFFFIW